MQDNQRRRYFSIRCLFFSSLFVFLYDLINRIVSFVVSDVKCEKQEPKPVHLFLLCNVLNEAIPTLPLESVTTISSFQRRRPWEWEELVK